MNTKDTTNRFSSMLLVIITAGWLILPCLAGAAHAGTVNLPQTGQTTTYAAGDDGALQEGVAWPNPRFTDNRDQTMTDNLTGLLWTKNANTPTVGNCTGGPNTWQAALDYVACLNTANYLGYSDWRLPNINELESLFNMGVTNLSAWFNSEGFTFLKYSHYWSSTTAAGKTSWAWGMGMVNSAGSAGMYDGYSFIGDKSNTIFAWPVRAGASGAFGNSFVCSTGQTTSYAAGDDGALQLGVAWPTPRFTDNGNQTVTDNLTGLSWTKDAGAPTVGSCTAGTWSWQAALDYVKCLNTANYLGYSEWRLPNRKELFSLRMAAPNPFTNVSTCLYWSSTTYAVNTSLAWQVATAGMEYASDKMSNGCGIWPVRGGQAANSVNLTISISGTGGGTVTTSAGTITWNGNRGTASYAPNTTVTLTATPDTISTLGKWSGCDTVSSGQCTVKMTGNRTLTVTFDTVSGYPLTITKTGFGDGTIATYPGTLTWTGNVGTAMYKPGDDVAITANPDKSSKFAGWTGWTGCNQPLCDVKITAKTDITVKFNKCSAAIKDFDGDGKSDILWQNSDTGDVAIWLMNGAAKKSEAFAANGVPKNWKVIASDDFDGDGKSDILWQNTDTGDVYVWIMDGTTPINGDYAYRGITSEWQIKAVGDF
ncbi:MAG: DUF1566 domain-containing protein, partial [Nitrospirae bacterium]|nr:DUF1566 domain-containing protein [Nitrospirota bacterium]